MPAINRVQIGLPKPGVKPEGPPQPVLTQAQIDQLAAKPDEFSVSDAFDERRTAFDRKVSDARDQVATEPFVPSAPRPMKPTAAPGFWKNLWESLKKAGSWCLEQLGRFVNWYRQGVQWLLYGISFQDFKTRKVYDEPGDSNHIYWNELQQSKKDVEANKPAEITAFSKLSTTDQDRYARLVALTEPTPGNKVGNPAARRALQKMLVDGRLTAVSAYNGASGSLLSALSAMASPDKALAAGIDRSKLVCETLLEAENPTRINQQARGTCAATTAIIILAKKSPFGFITVVGNLASPAGKARLPGGAEIERKPDWANNDDGDRSLPQRLFAPAIMELGGPFWGLPTYDNSSDRHKLGPVPVGGGMFSGGSAYVNTQLQGVKYDSNTFFHWNRDAEWQEIKDALAKGKTLIPVGVMWAEDGIQGGHELHIEKIEGGKVYFHNPWGMRETMDETEFKAHISSSEIPR
jgi:hypothetical protein